MNAVQILQLNLYMGNIIFLFNVLFYCIIRIFIALVHFKRYIQKFLRCFRIWCNLHDGSYSVRVHITKSKQFACDLCVLRINCIFSLIVLLMKCYYATALIVYLFTFDLLNHKTMLCIIWVSCLIDWLIYLFKRLTRYIERVYSM